MKNPEQHHFCQRRPYIYVCFVFIFPPHECKQVICYSANIPENPVRTEQRTCCGYTDLTQGVCLQRSASSPPALPPSTCVHVEPS